MDASTDSLQQGIAAYNKKDYDKALLLFQNVYNTHRDNSDAKKYSRSCLPSEKRLRQSIGAF
jgi:hypothetical protein